jgi:small subunit ribosomal protein S4e
MQIKRAATPDFWPLERKTKKFAIVPSPGPHPKNKCIPLGIILRDVLRYGYTTREVKAILSTGQIKVDGRIRKSKNFPVGLMDTLDTGKENYRILPNASGLALHKIDAGEAVLKPEKITSKKTLKKGKTQLNLFDGRNMTVEKEAYSTGDTVILDVGKNVIKQHIKMKKGALAIVTGGKNAGRTGKIKSVLTAKMQPAQVTLQADGMEIIVPKDYVFVIGEQEAAISLP